MAGDTTTVPADELETVPEIPRGEPPPWHATIAPSVRCGEQELEDPSRPGEHREAVTPPDAVFRAHPRKARAAGAFVGQGALAVDDRVRPGSTPTRASNSPATVVVALRTI